MSSPVRMQHALKSPIPPPSPPLRLGHFPAKPGRSVDATAIILISYSGLVASLKRRRDLHGVHVFIMRGRFQNFGLTKALLSEWFKIM